MAKNKKMRNRFENILEMPKEIYTNVNLCYIIKVH